MRSDNETLTVRSLLTLNTLSWNSNNIFSPLICDESPIFEDNAEYNIQFYLTYFNKLTGNEIITITNITTIYSNTQPSFPSNICNVNTLNGQAYETDFIFTCNNTVVS